MKTTPFQLKQDYLLAPQTTLLVGGEAQYFTRLKEVDNLPLMVDWAKGHNLPYVVLGGGSNVLVSDKGYPGLVIKNEVKGIRILKETKTTVNLQVGGGEALDRLVKYAVKRNWQGIECLSGIPGTIGGAVIQNANAYGQTIGDTVYRVLVFDTQKRIFIGINSRKCGFKYRDSLFKNKPRHIVTGVIFMLKKNKIPRIDYTALKERLTGKNLSLLMIRRTVLAIRKERSMIYDMRDSDSISAGSFFTNPITNRAKFDQIISQYGQEVPHWPEADGKVKLSAGWLIEKVGFNKGYIYRNTGLSSKHALVIINRGKATAAEIRKFSSLIAKKVKKVFNVTLQSEVVMIGFEYE